MDLNQMISHDVFTYHALGKSGWEVYRLLLDHGPLTIKVLADRSGKVPSTIRRALHKMKDVDMVRENDQSWEALPVDLDEVARRLGVAGIGERRRQRHIKERRSYRRRYERYQQKSLQENSSEANNENQSP